MNAKTSKLIRKWALSKGINYREAKRSWSSVPKPMRSAEREEMKQHLSF